MKIFILAGGFGTRLKSVVSDIPKPMAPIQNKPFLDYQINEIRNYFPKTIIYILTYYRSEVIEQYYEKDKYIKILKEKEKLGTGGSVKNALEILKVGKKEPLIILNGDTYIKPNLREMIFNSQFEITILASFQNKCDRYGTLKIENQKIIDFLEKEIGLVNSYINAGCYIFKNKSFFTKIKEKKFAIEDKFKEYLQYNSIGVFEYNDIFIDIGIPKDYEKMNNYIGKK